MNILVEHIAAMRERFTLEHGKPPKVLALGRWDARELARYAINGSGLVLEYRTPREFLRAARSGIEVWGAQVKVDGRIGRMPGALWWHADKRN